MVHRSRDRIARVRRNSGALCWMLVILGLAMLGIMAAACGGGDKATPPPATIIRASGQEQPTATQPSGSETLPMPPTIPSESSPSGEPYPLPAETVEAPAETPTPIVYPTAE